MRSGDQMDTGSISGTRRVILLSLELSASLGPQQEEQCEESGFGG
jgi:hypothetical protein